MCLGFKMAAAMFFDLNIEAMEKFVIFLGENREISEFFVKEPFYFNFLQREIYKSSGICTQGL